MSEPASKNADPAIPEWDWGSDPEHDEEKKHKVLIPLPLPYTSSQYLNLLISQSSLLHHCETRCSSKHTYYVFICQSPSVMILLKFHNTIHREIFVPLLFLPLSPLVSAGKLKMNFNASTYFFLNILCLVECRTVAGAKLLANVERWK